LSRDLAMLNTSYQSLLDEVRREIALDYLRTSPLSVEQIAQLVGYSDASNFRKAFKGWMGQTPSQYRDR
jgi:AraC-like DNA-binding protein